MGVAPDAPFPGDRVEAIRMGTTVATNALLERRFARTLLITNRGFADALRIGDQSRPDLFALDILRPEPLFAGVLEVDARLAADGAVIEPMDPAALAAQLADLPPGCPFAGRCAWTAPDCLITPPPAIDIGPGHQARCLRLDQVPSVGVEA